MKRKGGGAAEEEDGAGEEIPPFSDQVSRVWCSRVELKVGDMEHAPRDPHWLRWRAC